MALGTTMAPPKAPPVALPQTTRLSRPAINILIERGDGASINLVREGRSTARSSAGRGDAVDRMDGARGTQPPVLAPRNRSGC